MRSVDVEFACGRGAVTNSVICSFQPSFYFSSFFFNSAFLLISALLSSYPSYYPLFIPALPLAYLFSSFPLHFSVFSAFSSDGASKSPFAVASQASLDQRNGRRRRQFAQRLPASSPRPRPASQVRRLPTLRLVCCDICVMLRREK